MPREEKSDIKEDLSSHMNTKYTHVDVQEMQNALYKIRKTV